MAEVLKIISKALPEGTVVFLILFGLLLLFFKYFAEKFLKVAEDRATLAERQSNYMRERLEVVEKTLGINNVAYDLQQKQIKTLVEVKNENEKQLAAWGEAVKLAKTQAAVSEKRLEELMEQLALREDKIAELRSATGDASQKQQIAEFSQLTRVLLAPVQHLLMHMRSVLPRLEAASTEKGGEASGLSDHIRLVELRIEAIMIFLRADLETRETVPECSLLVVLHESIDSLGGEIEVQADAGEMRVFGQCALLRLVFDELIHNAKAHGALDRPIVVSVRADANKCSVRIENYVRNLHSEDEHVSRAGFGLFLVEKIVASLGGSFSSQLSPHNTWVSSVSLSSPLAGEHSKKSKTSTRTRWDVS